MGWSLLKKDVMESWLEPAYETSFFNIQSRSFNYTTQDVCPKKSEFVS